MEIMGLPAAQVVGAILIVAAIGWGFVQHDKVNKKGGDGGGGGGSSSSSSTPPPAKTETKSEG